MTRLPVLQDLNTVFQGQDWCLPLGQEYIEEQPPAADAIELEEPVTQQEDARIEVLRSYISSKGDAQCFLETRMYMPITPPLLSWCTIV